MSDVSGQSTRTGQLFINGKWVDGRGDETITVINPATEAVIGTVPQATVADVEDAVSAARSAFDEGPWPQMSVRERAAVLRRMAEGFADRRAELVDLSIAEAGSTRPLAEFLQVGTPIDHFFDLVDRILPAFEFETALPPVIGNGIGQGVVVREPFGVAALITPFNFPLSPTSARSRRHWRPGARWYSSARLTSRSRPSWSARSPTPRACRRAC
ncbi:Aldehyde dehydrogenase family protein [Gordonia westfalica]|uniref:Aldehyde dehydrogenase family protein n=1 Tax=Gordonia westfalica TaxID=158898 RepID=A0A1H2LIT3_9ACTN|nr:Aldehyde dehydrogenase family protein [Gordonia westfalica]